MRFRLLILFLVLWTSSAEHQTSQEESINAHPTLEHSFLWVDYSVLGVMLLVSCLIGTFYAFCTKKQETSQDFLLGGSSMGTLPMAMSLGASFITAIELLGNPAEMYSQGTQFWMTCVSFILVIPITSQLYLPVYMKLRLTSSYEYFNLRFHRHCRLLASGLYMLQMILYTSVAVYAPALALSHVTGLHRYIAVSLVYVVCIFYASQGGMKAVIMTDTFQAIVLLLSLFVIVALGMINAGGISSVWKDSWDTDRIEFFVMDPSPTIRHSFWSVVVGGTFYWATMFCSNQASVQKYMSVKSIGQVRKALWVSALSLIVIYTINFLTGMVLFSVYKTCDPLKASQISGMDQLLPLYVMNFMGKYPGIPGLFVAGIFAASLGTVASALNSLAALTCEDILNGLFHIQVPPSKGAAYARWISIFFGVLSFAFVFIVERLGSVLQVALSFNGMVGGITLGMFTLGMFIPWSNAKGTIAGALTALVLVLWICLGAQVAVLNGEIETTTKFTSIESCFGLNNTSAMDSMPTESSEMVSSFYRISYLWYSAIGCIVTVIIGTLVSFLTGPQDPADLDYDLLSPPIRYLLNRSPKKHITGITNFALELEDEKITGDTTKSPK
ncbi:sodium-coupled monocarboxylate transporter 1 [Fopius arisanus]|uniref:Slc5a8 protein n=1 Tax=Fopius arisanus TaxID=64838 RepID=A0A0C9RRN6_9HYME|nr:PREDICTED: sodium-coupled monocarboxylate transporter 1 [Fopius arisanus]XP_011310483.1 PREDICTED: sodium-coupled monocarboxylate transporter 1 [Fopius arisanus]